MGAAKPIKRCFLSHPYPPREEGGVQGWRLKADGAGPKEDWTLLALRRRDTAQAPWPPRLGPSCLSKPSSGRRERDGRKGGSPGSHPFPTLPSLQPQAPPDSEAPAAPPLPGPRSLSSARGTPACARHLCTCLSPTAQPAPMLRQSLSPGTLVEQMVTGLEARVWGSGPAPCMAPGCWQGPGS